MKCELSIQLGAAFFWGLTLLITLAASYCSWHARRILDNYLLERSLRKGQDSLIKACYRPMEERPTRRVRTPGPEIVLAQLPKPAIRMPDEQPGWRRLVAAE